LVFQENPTKGGNVADMEPTSLKSEEARNHDGQGHADQRRRHVPRYAGRGGGGHDYAQPKNKGRRAHVTDVF
jgi:hypothetical protein